VRFAAGLILALAVPTVLFGLIAASQATLGVALIGAGACLMIAGRIVQASAYHQEILRALAERTDVLRRY
jgi:hypothetical protein